MSHKYVSEVTDEDKQGFITDFVNCGHCRNAYEANFVEVGDLKLALCYGCLATLGLRWWREFMDIKVKIK